HQNNAWHHIFFASVIAAVGGRIAIRPYNMASRFFVLAHAAVAGRIAIRPKTPAQITRPKTSATPPTRWYLLFHAAVTGRIAIRPYNMASKQHNTAWHHIFLSGIGHLAAVTGRIAIRPKPPAKSHAMVFIRTTLRSPGVLLYAPTHGIWTPNHIFNYPGIPIPGVSQYAHHHSPKPPTTPPAMFVTVGIGHHAAVAGRIAIRPYTWHATQHNVAWHLESESYIIKYPGTPIPGVLLYAPTHGNKFPPTQYGEKTGVLLYAPTHGIWNPNQNNIAHIKNSRQITRLLPNSSGYFGYICVFHGILLSV
ncbi:MAG: hypothetical protein ACI308_07780, partial [Muribaculaceae bacterium]